MAIETFSPSTTAPNSASYRQVVAPNYYRGSFANDDTDVHDFPVNTRGKSSMAVIVQTTGSSTFSVSIYGLHADWSTSAALTDVGVVPIALGMQVNSTNEFYQEANVNFPRALIRVQSGDTGDANDPTVTVFANLHSN